MKRTIVFIGLIASALSLMAQVQAKIDPIEMMIGEQAQVTLTVNAADDATIVWPQLKPRQLLTPGVEVLQAQETAPHTFVIILTSFDGNLYHLPPFVVKVNGKEQKSSDLALKVIEVEVDTTKLDTFYGPRDVQDNPFQWSDWSMPFKLSLVVLVMLAICFYFYLRLRDNKPIVMSIPVHTTGTSVGVMKGGKLAYKQKRLNVKALPANMPNEILIDITKLDVAQRIKVQDIQTNNYEFLNPKSSEVLVVNSTRASATADTEDAAE